MSVYITNYKQMNSLKGKRDSTRAGSRFLRSMVTSLMHQLMLLKEVDWQQSDPSSADHEYHYA